MSEELIDSYVNRAAIADDTKFLTDQLTTALEMFNKVKSTMGALNGSTSLKDVAGNTELLNKKIAELTAQNQNLQKAYDNLAKKLADSKKATDDVAASNEKLSKTQDENIEAAKEFIAINGQLAIKNKVVADSYDAIVTQLTKNEIAGNKLKQQRRDLYQQLAEGSISESQLQKRLEDIRKEESSLSVSNQDLTRALKNYEKEAQAAAGSTNELRAQLNLALQAYDNLSAEDKKGQVGVNLKSTIDNLTEAVTEAEQSTGRFQRNVGNYPASAKIIVDALEKAKQKYEELAKAAKEGPSGPSGPGIGPEAVEDARRQYEALRSVVDDKQFIKYAASAGEAQKEVKAFTRVLVDMERRGEGNSQVAIDLRKHLAELTDQIQDAKQEIKALSSDTHSFDQFAGAVTFATDTIQTFLGAMSLSADSEQDVQEATKTLIALQTVANGIKGVATELTTRGTAANKLYEFSQKQVALVMDETAASGVRLRAALITIGFGAIIVGIGLLIANFDKVKRAITGVSKEQEALNNVMKDAGSEYANAVKTVSQLKTNIDLAKKGFIDKEKVIKEYNDSIGKTTGQVKSLDEAEKELVANGDAYIEMTLKKAVANIAFEKAGQKAFEIEEKKRKAAEEFLTTADKATKFGAGNISAPGFVPNLQDQATKTAINYNKEQSEKRKKAAIKESEDERKVYTDIANEATKAAAEIAKKYNFNGGSIQFYKETKKFRDSLLKDDADVYKKLAENQDAYLTTRLSAREKSFNIEKSILEGQKNAELGNLNAQLDIERQKASIDDKLKEELPLKEKQFADKRSEINKDYAEKQTLLERNLERDLINIRQTFLAKQKELDEQYNADFKKDQDDRLNASIEAIQKEVERRQVNSTEGQAAEIKALNDRYEKQIAATREGSKKRKKVEEQYAQDRAEIEYKYAIAEVKNQIWAAEQIIAAKKAAGLDVKDQELQLHDLKIKLSDIETQHVLDNDKKQVKSHQEKLDAIAAGIQQAKDVFDKVSDLVGGLISANIDRQKNAIQTQIDDIDKKKEKDIDAINASTATEQQKAEKIAVINARSQANKEALERRQRQLDLQRARFDKAKAITDIILNTAVAVTKLLATPWAAIAAGITGAAELAIAIAAPLPKFKTGRKGGPATFGVVGDGGVQEVVASPDLSQAYLTPATDTVTYLPKNWNVFPNVKEFQEQAMSMLHKPLPALPVIQDNNEGLIRAMAYEIGGLKRAIMGKQETHFHWDNGELKKAIQNGNDWWRYIQNKI